MEEATKELFNYGGVGVLAVLALGGLVALWRHGNTHNKACIQVMQQCADCIAANTVSNRELVRERTEANGALRELAEQLSRNNSIQTRHQETVLELLAKNIGK